MERIRKILAAFLPLVTDTNPEGKRKLSIGRAPLFGVLAIMLYKYATHGAGPDTNILAFITLAMAYNGFSKSTLAQGDGGNSELPMDPVAPPPADANPSEVK
jgi:hypothetical protein